jgi:hypothetical protein
MTLHANFITMLFDVSFIQALCPTTLHVNFI